MTHDEIRDAAYSLINKLERSANAHDLTAFAIQQVNAALEEAVRETNGNYVDGSQGTIEGQIARKIRALKVTP